MTGTAEPTRLVILGAGRAGGAVALALTRSGTPPIALWTRSEQTAAEARQEGLKVETGPLPKELSRADLVLLAVSDRAIAPLAAELAASGMLPPRAVIAHLSGAQSLEPLAPLGAHALGSLHPLASLASRRSPLSGYAALDATSAPAGVLLEALAGRLGLKLLRPRGDRALYHAAACLVGNYPQALMAAAVRLFHALGIDDQEAREALAPLLSSAASNAATLPGAASLSGPIVRGDLETVARHLAALDSRPELEEVAALYRSAGRVAAQLAGGASEPQLLRLLGQGQTSHHGED